jgi:hypothetical protein
VRQPAQRDEESRGGIVTALPSPPVRAGRTLGWLALAAALALIAGIGIGVGSQRLGEPDQTVLANAQLEAFPKYPGSKGEAAVETDSDGNRVLVVTMETSERVEDLQVWMIEASGKGLRPMGFIQQGSGRFTLPDTMDLKRFPIVDVSDEPLNDGNPAHSGNTVVRGALKI